MTQTTSPDNIPSPDLSDQYALTQDMANLADGAQLALIKRANMYVGTSAQRTAFTSAPEGVHWQDTNGARGEYVRQSGQWANTREDSGWLPMKLEGTGTQAMAGAEAPKCRVFRGFIVFQGGILGSGISAGSNSDRLSMPAAISSRMPHPWSGFAPSSTAAGSGVWIINPSGVMNLRVGTPVGGYYKIDGIAPIPIG